jgi:C1A family cysteine protease
MILTKIIKFIAILLLIAFCLSEREDKFQESGQTISKILDHMEMQGKKQKNIFKAFHYLYGKSYNLNSEEGLRRYRIFKQSAAWAKKENKKLGKVLFRVTKYSDMTDQEYKEMWKKTISEEMKKKEISDFLQEGQHPEAERQKPVYPGDFSHLEWETPIKDQSSCGSCWAFSVVGAIENHYHKLTGKPTYFSEQYLLDCDGNPYGCIGGHDDIALKWIMNNGLILQEDEPFFGYQQFCDKDLKKNEYKMLKDFQQYRQRSKDLQSKEIYFEDLIPNGPVIVHIDSTFDGLGWRHYRPLNFDSFVPPEDCKKLYSGGHAVVAVATVTENGQQYVIGRNSWGTNWGYKGYFKIPFFNSCGMITGMGLQPAVYRGAVPNEKQVHDLCVTLFDDDYNYTQIIKTCDGVAEVPKPFKRIKFLPPPVLDLAAKEKYDLRDGKVAIRYYYGPNCDSRPGSFSWTVTQSTKLGGTQSRAGQSLSYMKKASKKGCVDFYLSPCATGTPLYTICKDIKDTNLENLSRLKDVNSIVACKTINSLSFYENKNFMVFEKNSYYNQSFISGYYAGHQKDSLDENLKAILQKIGSLQFNRSSRALKEV